MTFTIHTFSPEMSTSLIAIIPARGGSKGLPGKNKKLLCGVPLLARPILHAQESGIPMKVFVTTDSSELQTIAQQYGADCPFLRDPSLAQDDTTTEETLKDALTKAEDYYQQKFDYTMFLTPTDVYRKSEWLRECYETAINNPEVESVFIGYKTTKNFWEERNGKWTRVCEWMNEYGSRQTRRGIVREDTGVCLVSKADLWRRGKRVGDEVRVIIKESLYDGMDIHTQADLDISEYALGLSNE